MLSEFIRSFIKAPEGKTPQAILERVRYWIDVANDPAAYSKSQDNHAIKAKRRSALQNINRLLANHPEVEQLLKKRPDSE